MSSPDLVEALKQLDSDSVRYFAKELVLLRFDSLMRFEDPFRVREQYVVATDEERDSECTVHDEQYDPAAGSGRRRFGDNQAGSGWLLGITDQFRKSIRKKDRKLQGRVLDALGEVARDPITVRGDTVKPLKYKEENLWRYRLGDFRLVYHVNEALHQITLLTLEPRGSVYAD